MKRKKIVPVDYGVASSYDDIIEINRKLKGDLRKRILKHELSHDSGKYSIKDFKTDFQAKNSHFFKSFLFALRNLEAMIGFFPVMYSYYKKCITINESSFIPFLYFGIIWLLFWFLLFRINIIQIMIGYFCLIIIINLFLLIYTHFYQKYLEIEKLRRSY